MAVVGLSRVAVFPASLQYHLDALEIGASRFQSDLSLSYETSFHGAAKGKGAARSIGIRRSPPAPELLALAPRPPAVAKPKFDAKRKEAPKGEAVKPVGNAKGLVKAKALGVNAVAPFLLVACGLLVTFVNSSNSTR